MRPKIGMKARLLTVALVPSLALMAFAYGAAAPRRRAAVQADSVRNQTLSLATLVNLRYAVIAERASSEIVVRTRGYGLTVAQASAYLGYDVTVVLARGRARVVSAADRAGSVGQRVLADLQDVRAQVDAGSNKQDRVSTAYEALDQSVGRMADTHLATLVRSVDAVSSGIQLQHAITALTDASRLFEDGREVQGQLAFMLIAQGPERQSHQLLLAAAQARYEGDKTELDRYVGATALAAERVRVGSPSVLSLDRATGTALDPTKAATLPSVTNHPEGLATIFAGTVDYQNLLYETISATAVDLVTAAGAVQEKAYRDYRDATRTAGLVVAIAVLWALLNAFSLARPLRRLTRAVDSVRRGELHTKLRVGNTTREIAKVEDALIDLVDNMRVVEQQAAALAAGRLDEPVLSRSVPGAIGELLRQSVERLASSIAEERTLRERLEYAASHDALTGLPNRWAALEHLEGLLARAVRQGRSTSLLFMDLDDFKRANDGHGHAVGDQLLVEVAGRLKGIVRTGDVLARLGGDEFLIMFDGDAGADGAVTLAKRVVEVLAEPFVIADTRFDVGVSVGVARSDDGAITGEDLLKQADIALYRAKDKGKGRVEVFDHELQRQLDERAETEAALADAITTDQLVLHYQPVVDTFTGRAVSVEALVRWERPGHGLVPPGEFIAVAEQSNLICEVGRWVLGAAARAAADVDQAVGRYCLGVAVNISGRHVLSGTLVDDVRRAVTVAGVDPARLTIEITETVLLLDLPIVIDQLQELRAMGVSIAIDDYGTGYTSLNHLRYLPADVIKIDQSFVAQLDEPREAPLVRLINDIGHTLSLLVVAEGVETAEQQAQLTAMGCDRLQGFHLSRPLPLDDLDRWMAGSSSHVSGVSGVSAESDDRVQSSSR